jgi:6,7-dimethyl-8-ribityllumazine synthase
VDTLEQALARAARPGESGSNKGAEAADVVVEMTSLLDSLGKGD